MGDAVLSPEPVKKPRKWRLIASVVVIVMALAAVVILFVPLVGVEAVPPNFQAYVTTTAIEGNQTHTLTLVATPQTYNSTASLSYCFWGYGALFENGTYYPLTTSHLQVEGAFCPTPQP
jgi:hypothetical protein